DRFGLDQFFESAFPLLFLNSFLRLSLGNIIVILLFFTFLAYRGSYFWHYIIYRPPLENYPRVIRSTVRLREWRACHQPLARWHSLLNLTSFLSNRVLVAAFFRLTGTYERGLQNTLAVQVKETSFTFPTLPRAFHRFRILLLTDLHLDGLEGLTERIIDQVRDIEVDLCLIGGDIRMETYGPVSPCLRELRRLLPHIRSRHGILGVLGNHDCIEMTPDLEEAGVIMLINDSWSIERDGEQIWVAGVDDPHYYRMDDAAKAFHHVPADAFKIFLAHSPEAYKGAANFSPHLYLCGHTHGGQIRLPGGKAILTNSRVPRFTSEGKWNYQGMKGYTCRGAGSSGVPLRFNCPGEISLITMHRKTV
ncbi:MAG: metallophosphoesterase family protein, partial [Deltaproteobacteria bacterium]|nr:metallophosphoesterase family protein [Deltaproteobacteria bacterium]